MKLQNVFKLLWIHFGTANNWLNYSACKCFKYYFLSYLSRCDLVCFGYLMGSFERAAALSLMSHVSGFNTWALTSPLAQSTMVCAALYVHEYCGELSLLYINWRFRLSYDIFWRFSRPLNSSSWNWSYEELRHFVSHGKAVAEPYTGHH